MKALNSEAKPIKGTTVVRLKVGDWEGECGLMVMPLDDYRLILGIDFFTKVKVGLVPYLSEIFIHDEKSPCFLKASFVGHLLDGKQKEKIMLAQISKAGNKSGKQSLVAALVEINPEPLVGIPEESVDVSNKFKAGMPKGELSKTPLTRQNLINKEFCEGSSSSPTL